MKTKLHLLYLLAGMLFLTGCHKEKETSVWINFINTTASKITKAKTEEVELGSIASKGQTGYKKFDNIGSATIPVILFNGTINGEYLESRPLRCGNGVSKLPPGKYDVLIETVDYGTTPYLPWHLNKAVGHNLPLQIV